MDSQTNSAYWKKIKRTILLGWSIVLICSLIIYNALLFSSMNKEMWNSLESSANIVAANTASSIKSGLWFGKTLERFQGLDKILKANYDVSKMPVAVLDAKGERISALGNFVSFDMTAFFGHETEDFRAIDSEDTKTIAVPLYYRDNVLAGYVCVQIEKAPLKELIAEVYRDQIYKQICIGLLGLAVLWAFIALRERRNKDFAREKIYKSVRIASIIVFLLVMSCNGAFALQALNSQYTGMLKADAQKTGILLSETLKRFLLVGISFDNMSRLDTYLQNITQTHNNAIALSLINPLGQTVASSTARNVKLLPNPENLPVLNTGLNGTQEANWLLRISLVYDAWFEQIKTTFLNLVTIIAISLIFMVELFLLFMRGIEFFHQKRNAAFHFASQAKQSSLLRPITFFMIFATDMTISFIPLRMAELIPDTVGSKEMLLGLPISAEMGMTGLSVLLAGYWIKKQGAKIPFIAGLLFLAVGYLSSMLAVEYWQFILARGVVGIGYGLALLTAQAYTVKDGMLADMFAGVYAGSLCGSAMGAMLAEQFGYGTVFLVSACILLLLVPFPFLILKNEHAEPVQNETKITFGQICSVLRDKNFLAFILLCLIPSAILTVGYLNFFLPVYLKNAQVSQSDIGRIYMLNCLVVIYSGPFFSSFVMKMQKKAGVVCLAGIISAFALLVLAVFPPLFATVLGAVLIGLATGLNIPAYSEYLLQLDIAKAIGVDQSMSLFDALQRVGQVLGPIFAGMLLLSFSIDNAAWIIGIGIILISLLFMFVDRFKKS